MRGRGDHDQVPVGLGRQAGEKLVSLVPSATADASESTGMGFIDDHQFGASPQEFLLAAVGLDEVNGDDHVGVHLEQRPAKRAVAFQAVDRAGEYKFGIDMELVTEFCLPLLGQVRRAEHAKPGHFPTVHQFLGDKNGFDGLANTHVVGNEHPHRVQLEGHEQRHELVGPGLDGDPGERTKRSSTGTKTQANGVTQQPARAVIADFVGRWQGKLGRVDLLQ